MDPAARLRGRLRPFILITLISTAVPARAGDVPANEGLRQLKQLAHLYYASVFEDQPVRASDQGLHDWDDRLADYSPQAIRERAVRASLMLAELVGIDRKGWDRDDEIAFALFRSDLEQAAFYAEIVRPESRDPGLYVSECSNAIFSLLKKEYAPKAQRARSATSRLRAMPALLETGLGNLTEPVPILSRLAAESVDGMEPLFKESLMTLADDLPSADRAALVDARDRALAALRAFASKLRERIPSMTASLAMGRTAYNRMLSRIHLLPFDADFVAALGQIELARTKALESWLPDPNAAEVRVAGAARSNLPKDQADFLARYEARTADLVAHIRKHDLLTIPPDIGPFRILELPKAFKPTSPGGFMNPPGLFDPDPTGFYFIPTYDPNSPNFYIRAAILDPRPILGHEGIPGHFLQISIAHANPDSIRRVHEDGVFVEGWGLYEEEMLLRTGLYADSPGGAAQVLRLARYRAARVTVDVKLHTGEWSFDQAVEYFVREGGLDRESATGEAAGAAATPGQKIHYTVGKWQILRLLGRYRDVKAGAFKLRDFHDTLLSQGSIPLSLAEWSMLGDDATYRAALGLAYPEQR